MIRSREEPSSSPPLSKSLRSEWFILNQTFEMPSGSDIHRLDICRNKSTYKVDNKRPLRRFKRPILVSSYHSSTSEAIHRDKLVILSTLFLNRNKCTPLPQGRKQICQPYCYLTSVTRCGSANRQFYPDLLQCVSKPDLVQYLFQGTPLSLERLVARPPQQITLKLDYFKLIVGICGDLI